MIITRLNGGIGNQLFQYAIGRSLAELKKTILKLDISYFSWEVNSLLQREFLLNNYNISCDIANPEEIEKVLYAKNNLRFVLRKLSGNGIPWYKENLVKEKNLFFDRNIFRVNRDTVLEGYWPNERYFKNIREVLLIELKLKPSHITQSFIDIKEKISSAESVSVHIRRADYLNETNRSDDLFGVCEPEYYQKAVSYIKDKIKTPIFHIFTDDIDWVRNNIPVYKDSIIISDNNFRDYEELQLMSFCKHNIIANSTFSWWGAWLNENPQKIIVAPKKWYNDKKYQLFYENSDFVPLTWIRL